MSDNDSIDTYAAKLSGIASKSATLGEVMSKHKLVKKFLTSLPRRFVHIVAALEQVLDLKTTGFEDVVSRLKAYEERVKEEDKANDPQENLLYARTEYSNGNNDSSEGRGRGSYSRGRRRGRGQGRGWGNSQNHGQRDSLKNHEDDEQKGKQHEKRDLSHIQCYRCDQYGHFVSKCPERNRNHEVNLNETQEKGVYHEEETIFINEEKYTPPKRESNTNDEDDVWYFDNGTSKHMTSNYSYFSELNENITRRVRFENGSCVSINGKGSILLQGKNEEQKLLKDVYYIPAIRSNVISLGQATISGYDISIRGDFLTMRDSWGSLLIKVTRSANRLYKDQLKVGKEYTNEVGRESDESRSDDTPNRLTRLETIRLFIALTSGKGYKAVYRKVPNGEFIIVAVNVDDLFVTGTSLDLINEFKKRMASQFEMSDLGIEVSQRKDCVEIKQERYARKILKEAGMEDCNATSYPMEKDLKLSKAEDEPEVQVQNILIKSGGCALRYLLLTRPVVFEFTRLVWLVQSLYAKSKKIQMSVLSWHILRYLKQTTVALSSCEAEFMAAIAAACQAIWLRELLAEVTGLERQKVIIRVDNKSAIALSKNPVFHGRSKHIHTRYHFIRECVENEQVIVEHVSGENQRVNEGLGAH
ncbi:uncharacterized mitochondrial protein-like protein [Tanacetum coccineum]